MKYTWILIVAFFSTYIGSIYAASHNKGYVLSILELDFESAKLHVDMYDKKTMLPFSSFIIQLIENAGQNPELDKPIGISLKNFDSDENKLLYSFANGLFHLYNNPSNNIAFQELRKALTLAREQKSPLLKLIYISMLELYGQEIVQSSDDYYKYLEDFGALSENIIDRTWYFVHRIRYFSKSTKTNFLETYFLEFSKFESFFIQNWDRIPEKLLGYYFYYLGLFKKQNRNFEGSKSSYLKVIDLGKGLNHYHYLVYTSYVHLCHIASIQEDFTAAKEYLNTSKMLWNKSDTIRSRFVHNRFSAFWYHEYKGELDSAFFLLKKSIIDESKLDFRKNTLKISESNIKYQTAEKEKQILVEQQRATKNRNWLIAATLALLLGSGIAILLQKNTAKKRQLAEQEAQLKQQKVENLLKEQELVSIDAMIAGQEKERQKVAGELHDDLGSLMATIKLHFDNAKVGKKDPALQNAQRLLEEAYQKVRGMAHSKNSGVMSNQGLLPAIKKMAKTITETDALQVTVEDFGLGERMENSLELSIFRMVQELVANAIKHAQATKVTIQLTQHKDNLNIIVEDNGKGFDRMQLDKEKSGMGLTNIEKRVEHLEGNFTIDSVLGKGTSILIDIPV